MRDVIVVGGGIAGLSTAYWLVQAGMNVTLLERNEIGHGTTWAAAGMLAPVHELDFTETHLLHLGQESLGLYAEWAKVLPQFGYERKGTLEIALTANDLPLLRRQFDFQREQGQVVQWLEGEALRELEPMLSPNVPAGVLASEDGQVDPRRLVTSLRIYLRDAGVNILENTGVQGWTHTGERVAVHTPMEDYLADAVVLATGMGTIGTTLNPVRVYPVKGQMLAVEHSATHRLLDRPVRIRNKALGNGYLVPKEDRIIIGSTSEEMGTDARLTAGGVLDILRRAYAAFPGVYELPLTETWTGLRPATLDRQPVIHRDASAPVWWLNGLYRHGILLGPLMGKRMADTVLHSLSG